MTFILKIWLKLFSPNWLKDTKHSKLLRVTVRCDCVNQTDRLVFKSTEWGGFVFWFYVFLGLSAVSGIDFTVAKLNQLTCSSVLKYWTNLLGFIPHISKCGAYITHNAVHSTLTPNPVFDLLQLSVFNSAKSSVFNCCCINPQTPVKSVELSFRKHTAPETNFIQQSTRSQIVVFIVKH